MLLAQPTVKVYDAAAGESEPDLPPGNHAQDGVPAEVASLVRSQVTAVAFGIKRPPPGRPTGSGRCGRTSRRCSASWAILGMAGQAAAAVLPNSRYRRSHRDRPGDNSGRPDLDLKPAWAAGRR